MKLMSSNGFAQPTVSIVLHYEECTWEAIDETENSEYRQLMKREAINLKKRDVIYNKNLKMLVERLAKDWDGR